MKTVDNDSDMFWGMDNCGDSLLGAREDDLSTDDFDAYVVNSSEFTGTVYVSNS